MALTQSAFHQLRLVCRSFAEALVAPWTSRCLLLQESFPVVALPSLLTWISRYGDSVQSLTAHGGSDVLPSVLVALKFTSYRLLTASLAQATFLQVGLLSEHSSLTAIDLKLVSITDLQCLQGLPSLRTLCLEGEVFSGLSKLPHLTHLRVTRANAICSQDCAFVSCLRKLLLNHAVLAAFTTQGISVCHALRELSINESCVEAEDVADHLNLRSDTEPRIPPGMAALSSLTSLQLSLRGNVDHFNLQWLSGLTSLRVLGLLTRRHVEVTPHLTALTGLIKLGISADSLEGDAAVQIKLRVDWAAMKSLQFLQIGPGHVALDVCSLLGLCH